MRRYPDDGRFEVRGDPEEVADERRVLGKYTRRWFKSIEPGLSPKDEYWLVGTDRQTGERVQIHPRGETSTWVIDLAAETVARRVQALALPHTVPVLHVGPGIVFAAPPPVQPRPSLAIEAAAACALQACEVTARLHAQGCGPLGFGPSHLRLVEESRGWQIRWLVPGVPELDMFEALELADDRAQESEHPRWGWTIDPIQHDLWQLAFFFFSLLAPDTQSRGTLDPGHGLVLRTLSRIRNEGPNACGIEDAASMARLFAVMARLPAKGADALPIVRILPRLYPDWDEVIADGESLLNTEYSRLEHIRLPLAAAYHQRASRAWARGDLGAALHDVERALAIDPHAPYHTTRAVLLDALDRRAEARQAISAAFATKTRTLAPSLRIFEKDPDDKVEGARAHLTRGIIGLREGLLDQAEADLRYANKIHPTPLSARALAAAMRRHAALPDTGAGAGAATYQAIVVAGDWQGADKETLERERIATVAANNAKCPALLARIHAEHSPCPHCHKPLDAFRFVESRGGGAAYFICLACGRSFGPEDVA